MLIVLQKCSRLTAIEVLFDAYSFVFISIIISYWYDLLYFRLFGTGRFDWTKCGSKRPHLSPLPLLAEPTLHDGFKVWPYFSQRARYKMTTNGTEEFSHMYAFLDILCKDTAMVN